MRYFLAILILSGLSFGQGNNNNNFGGGSGSSSLPVGTVAPAIVQSGLVAQYDFNQGSGTTLTDVSTNGNNGTLCAAGAAPTWGTVASGGGLTFVAASSQCVTLPAALNTAATIQIFANYQQVHYDNFCSPPMMIVGNGTAANSAGIQFQECANGTGIGATNGFQSLKLISGVAGSKGGWRGSPEGNFLVTLLLDATSDQLWINNYQLTGTVTGGSAGLQTAGAYQLGGRGSGYANSNSSFWSGKMYYALFYNRELTAAEINQNYTAVTSALATRGIYPYSGNNFAGNLWVIDGDSLPGAAASWMQYTFPITTNEGTWNGLYVGQAGYGLGTISSNSAQYAVDSYLSNFANTTVSTGALRILNVQIGTNNLGSPIGGLMQQYADYIRQRRAAGWNRIVINTVPDSTGRDAGKNTFNTALRQLWRTLGADYLIDLGADPNLGCDACAGNTAFFNVDGLHPNAVGQYEFGFIMEKVFNHILGNNDFSSARTYTTTAPAATAITAASESTNTVTLTFAATPGTFTVGADLTITGVTPAGYNTSASNHCHILTANATTITCLNPTAALGAGSVFGTAATTLQQDDDVYVILGGSATTPNFTLQSCLGFTGTNLYIKHANTTSPWTVTPFLAAETIDGAASITMPTATSGNNPVVVLQSTLVSSSAGGCVWRRLQ